MIEISIVSLADAPAIISLQRLSYQSEAKLYNDWSLPALTQTLESLELEFANSIILKAVIDCKIVGSVRAKVEWDICKIGRLVVHPEFQRQGIGSHLLREIEAMHKDVRKFELFTGSKSESNIALYKRNGYGISHTAALSDTIELIFFTKGNNVPKRFSEKLI